MKGPRGRKIRARRRRTKRKRTHPLRMTLIGAEIIHTQMHTEESSGTGTVRSAFSG